MIDCYGNTNASTGSSESNKITLTNGNYVASKPFNDWAEWSHSWEGFHYGFTGGKNANGIYKDLTNEKAKEIAMRDYWKPNNIDLIKDSSVAIACMWCVFWTGNAHLLYQAIENPNEYGGRPNPLPKGHYRMSEELVNKINQQQPSTMFTKIKKQLGWFGQLSQPQRFHYGHRKRWYTVNFHNQLILNDGTNFKVLEQPEFLQMLEKL